MSDGGAEQHGSDPQRSGRREGDRRKEQAPFDGEDRRKGDRRSGTDRRKAPRDESLD